MEKETRVLRVVSILSTWMQDLLRWKAHSKQTGLASG
jgi:hypothetical protein